MTVIYAIYKKQYHICYRNETDLQIFGQAKAQGYPRNSTPKNYVDKASVLLGNLQNEPIVNTLFLITKYRLFKE